MEAVATLPTYIPLPEAANRYGLSEAALRRAVEDGIIKGGVFANQILLSEEDVRRVKRKGMSKSATIVAEAPAKLISIEDAARKYEIPVGVLEKLIKEHLIRVRNNGERLLFEEDVQAMQHLSRTKFKHLENKGITLSEAEERYGIPTGTTSRWAQKKKIRVVKRVGRRLYVNEADVAYAKLLGEELGMRKGKGILPDRMY